MASLNALSESDAAAVARYKETAALSRGRLAEIQARQLHLAPRALQPTPTPRTLHPTPSSPHPTAHILHPASRTLQPPPYHLTCAEIQAEAAAHARAGGASSHNEAERMARVSWLCTMLLNTSEEALRAKHALMRAREHHISEQLQTCQSDAEEERAAAEVLRRDRQALEQNMAELGSKQRRQAMEGQQQRTRDASKLQALQEQLRQVQTSGRLAEAA